MNAIRGQARADRVLAGVVPPLWLGFVLFVVLGGIAVRWRRWMALLHLPCAACGVAIEHWGWVCPLTPLKNQLGALGGERGYAGGSVERHLVPVVHPEPLSADAGSALAIALVAAKVVEYAWALRGRRGPAVGRSQPPRLTRGLPLLLARPGEHPVLRFTRKGTIMKDMENLFAKAIGEIERILNTKTVVGDPITVEGNTLIPIVSVGFGFGVGAGEGTDPKKGAGSGGGTGGGGGVKPVAVIIVSKDGVRVESLKSGAASLLEKVADVAAKFAPGKPATS